MILSFLSQKTAYTIAFLLDGIKVDESLSEIPNDELGNGLLPNYAS